MKKLAVLLLFFTATVLFADYAPYKGIYYSIPTEHFNVIFTEKDEPKAREVVSYCEEIYKKLQEFSPWKPFRRTLIVLVDKTDNPNGLATTFPRNTIYLYTVPTDLSDSLRDFANPLYSLLLHEMTHILQIDQIRGAAWFWRVLFGRSYFPFTGTFTWFLEGSAVYSESTYADHGRLQSGYNKAIVDEYIRSRSIPSYTRIVYPIVDPPYNTLAYHLGGRFLKYIIDTYGLDSFKEFCIDLSDDFWPFVYQFALKFQTIYGKSLQELWDEWREYEYNNAELSVQKVSATTFDSEGIINDITSHAGNIYYSQYSRAKGRGVYRVDSDGVQKRLFGESPSRLVATRGGLLMIKNTANFDCNTYNDLFHWSERYKTVRRLTFARRVTALDYNPENNFGVYIADGKLYSFALDNRYTTIEETHLDVRSFDFIGNIHLSSDASRLAFSVRSQESNYQIATFDFATKETVVIDNIRGKVQGWNASDELYFIGETENLTTDVFSHNVVTGATTRLLQSGRFVQGATIEDENIWIRCYSDSGEQLLRFPIEQDESFENVEWSADRTFPTLVDTTEYKKKFYNPFIYLNPNWAIFPAIISHEQSNLLFGYLPYITVGASIYATSPLERFSYQLDVSLDYINYYPTTTSTITFRLPNLTLSHIFNTKRLSNNEYYFQNNAVLGLSLPFDNENSIFFNLNFANGLTFANKDLFSINQLRSNLGYSYLRSHPAASVWNTGVVASISNVTTFTTTTLNTAVLASIEARAPIEKHHFFFKTKAGYSLDKGSFSFYTEHIAINKNVTSTQVSFSEQIDFKGLSAMNAISTSNMFIYGSLGAFFTLYERTHYWKFATIGFYGIHLRPFMEYVWSRGIYGGDYHVVDAGVDFIADFFIAYGNVPVSFVQGNVITYINEYPFPIYNGYFYINIPLAL